MTNLYKFINGQWVVFEPGLGHLYDAVEDTDGHLWVLTAKGKVYEMVDDVWLLRGEALSSRIYHSSGTIWLIGTKEAYHLSGNNDALTVDITLDSQHIDPYALYVLDGEFAGFITKNNVWQISGTELEEIFSTKLSIKSGTLNNNLLYLSSEDGVYRVDLSK